jgi:hypothetical protein
MIYGTNDSQVTKILGLSSNFYYIWTSSEFTLLRPKPPRFPLSVALTPAAASAWTEFHYLETNHDLLLENSIRYIPPSVYTAPLWFSLLFSYEVLTFHASGECRRLENNG